MMNPVQDLFPQRIFLSQFRLQEDCSSSNNQNLYSGGVGLNYCRILAAFLFYAFLSSSKLL